TVSGSTSLPGGLGGPTAPSFGAGNAATAADTLSSISCSVLDGNSFNNAAIPPAETSHSQADWSRPIAMVPSSESTRLEAAVDHYHVCCCPEFKPLVAVIIRPDLHAQGKLRQSRIN